MHLDGLLALCSEPNALASTKVQYLVLILWNPLSQSPVESTAQSTPPRISHGTCSVGHEYIHRAEHSSEVKLVDMPLIQLKEAPLLGHMSWTCPERSTVGKFPPRTQNSFSAFSKRTKENTNWEGLHHIMEGDHHV